MFCTAWPAPPFIKLSIADKIINLFFNNIKTVASDIIEDADSFVNGYLKYSDFTKSKWSYTKISFRQLDFELSYTTIRS